MRIRAYVFAVAIAVSLAGCSVLEPEDDESTYFVLASKSEAAPATDVAGRTDVYFGLGPVKLPGYLDTQQIVRSGPAGDVQYVADAFWAEPLADGFARALLYRTAARIGTPHAVAFPWYSTTRVDWRVPVDVLRFEATTDGRAVLVARWRIERVKDGAIVAGAESSFEEAAGLDPALVVNALNRCIDRLADTIGAAVQRQPRAGDSGRAPR